MITYSQLVEGVYDPNIFKAIFLAGGPGSGKSYVAGKTIRGQGLKVVNSDDAFEVLLKKAGLSSKMPESEKEPRDAVRARAKRITATRKSNYLDGRLGLIIDGTGRDYDKIVNQASELQQLGYDTYMVFVNTNLEATLKRNDARERTVPVDIVKKRWNKVQKNMKALKSVFKGNFQMVDNSDHLDPEEAQQKFDMLAKKGIDKFLKKPIKNKIAKDWIKKQKILTKQGIK